MTDENKNRINIEDLAKPEEELTAAEANEIQGGTFYGTGVYKTTDARSPSGNTIGGALGADRQTTIGGAFSGDPGTKMGDGSV